MHRINIEAARAGEAGRGFCCSCSSIEVYLILFSERRIYIMMKYRMFIKANIYPQDKIYN